MSISDITLKLTHSEDEENLFRGSFTLVNVDILLKRTKIGYISATIVNRQAIADGCAYEAFDDHSADMQWIGCALMENRYGRTQLQSLVEYDDMEFDFMYISEFHIDDEFQKNGASDVGATALRQFLYHPFIKGNLGFGCWKVSSAAYVLDPSQAMTPVEREKFHKERQQNPFDAPSKSTEQLDEEQRHLDGLARADANQFLRNGFFQDPALASGGGSDARILVVSYGTTYEVSCSSLVSEVLPATSPSHRNRRKDYGCCSERLQLGQVLRTRS
jgi:hypothetical protein